MPISYYSCHHRHALSTQVSLFGVKIDLGSTSASVDMDVILVGIVCATAACYLITTTACTYPAEPIHPHLDTSRTTTNVGTNVGTTLLSKSTIGARTYQRLTQSMQVPTPNSIALMHRFGADDGFCRHKELGRVCDAGRVCHWLRRIHLLGNPFRNGDTTQRRYQLMRWVRVTARSYARAGGSHMLAHVPRY